MATVNLRTGFGTPSPLAVDLALARVDLAALRARRGVEEIDQEARDSANLLREFFSRQIHAASTSAQISPDEVPEQSVREAIQQSLASIVETKPRLDVGDAELLQRLIGLLSNLADTGRCEAEQAKRLHSALAELDAKRAAASPGIEEATVWELFNAFS